MSTNLFEMLVLGNPSGTPDQSLTGFKGIILTFQGVVVRNSLRILW